MPKLGSVAIVAAIAFAPHPASATIVPLQPTQATERMVIRAEGSVGVILDIPAAAAFHMSDVSIASRGATVAFLVTAPHHETPCDPTYPPETCLSLDLIWRPGWVFATTFRELEPGLLDLYIIADGPLDITVRFRGLSGERTIDAAATVTARIEAFTPSCPSLHTCNVIASGGASHFLSRGLVASVAVVEWPTLQGFAGIPDYVPSKGSTTTCIYPHSWFAPNTPAGSGSRLTGCDLVNTHDPIDGIRASASFLSPASAQMMAESAASGDVYAGFISYNLTGIGPDRIRAYGLWLEEGIS